MSLKKPTKELNQFDVIDNQCLFRVEFAYLYKTAQSGKLAG
ncbi:hypothetical protein ADIS_0966 [Lunatimonas lonarensis]|uniref:Uncharacterized protein n=1 Tax=Lunatimonas lonarensis TaxID=1232681 RepID=R7ZWV8_9BACT|nr:hypothetical protein ADIS_0966 [Lunatimonas lonarensis]